MRCLQTRQFGYIYNAWSDGTTRYQAEPMGGLTFRAMQQAAASQKAASNRVEMLVHRVPEEFYDFAADPDALRNLIADPKYLAQVAQARKDLRLWMERTQDPLLETFRARVSPKQPGS
jgi:N-sulfoglucosamine sulfohydrolase